MTFGDTILHTGRHHAVAIGDALEDGLDGEPGTVTGQGLKAQGVEDDMAPLRLSCSFFFLFIVFS